MFCSVQLSLSLFYLKIATHSYLEALEAFLFFSLKI